MARNQKAVGLNPQRKTLYLTEELGELVRQEAFRNKTTESEVVREALTRYYAQHKCAYGDRAAGG